MHAEFRQYCLSVQETHHPHGDQKLSCLVSSQQVSNNLNRKSKCQELNPIRGHINFTGLIEQGKEKKGNLNQDMIQKYQWFKHATNL